MRAFSETLAVHKKETEFAVVAICSFSSFYFSLFLRSKGSQAIKADDNLHKQPSILPALQTL